MLRRHNPEIISELNEYFTNQSVPNSLKRTVTDSFFKTIKGSENSILEEIKKTKTNDPLYIEPIIKKYISLDAQNQLLNHLFADLKNSYFFSKIKTMLSTMDFDKFFLTIVSHMKPTVADEKKVIFDSNYVYTKNWKGIIFLRSGTMDAQFQSINESINQFDVLDLLMCDTNDIYLNSICLNTNAILLKSTTPIVFCMLLKDEISQYIKVSSLTNKEKTDMIALLTKNDMLQQLDEKKKTQTLYQQKIEKIQKMAEAIKNNDMITVQNIIYDGFDLNTVVSNSNETFVFFPVYHKNLEILKYFVEQKASLNQLSNKGWNVLTLAVTTNWFEGVKYLISVHCPCVVSKDNETILHAAILTGNKEMIAYIINCIDNKTLNIDRFAKNHDGTSALELTDDIEIKHIIKPKTQYGYAIER